jgi:hypothetical protein
MLWHTLHATRMCPFRLAVPPPTRAAGWQGGQVATLGEHPAVFSAAELTACRLRCDIPRRSSGVSGVWKPRSVVAGSLTWQVVQRVAGTSGGMDIGKDGAPVRCTLSCPSATNLCMRCPTAPGSTGSRHPVVLVRPRPSVVEGVIRGTRRRTGCQSAQSHLRSQPQSGLPSGQYRRMGGKGPSRDIASLGWPSTVQGGGA